MLTYLDSFLSAIAFILTVLLSIAGKIIALLIFPTIIVYLIYRAVKQKKPSGLEIINQINDAPIPENWKFDGYRDPDGVAFDPFLHPSREISTAFFHVEKCYIAMCLEKKVSCTTFHFVITNFKPTKSSMSRATFNEPHEGGLSCSLPIPNGGYFRQLHAHESTSQDLIQKIKDLHESRTPAEIDGNVIWWDFEDPKLRGRGNFHGFNDKKNSCPAIFLTDVQAAA